MKKGEHKVRAERILALAHALIVEEGVDITTQVELPPLANILKDRADVSYDTAKRYIRKAIDQGQGKPLPYWGGVKGNGSGRPRKGEPGPPKTVTIHAGNPIRAAITHSDGGYEPLGHGVVSIQRSGAERIVKVDLGEGKTLVLTVF